MFVVLIRALVHTLEDHLSSLSKWRIKKQSTADKEKTKGTVAAIN